MQVTKLTTEQIGAKSEKHQYSVEELQREYDYILTEQITKKLLERGLISEEQFHKIMTKNRQTFCPLLSDLYSAESLL